MVCVYAFGSGVDYVIAATIAGHTSDRASTAPDDIGFAAIGCIATGTIVIGATATDITATVIATDGAAGIACGNTDTSTAVKPLSSEVSSTRGLTKTNSRLDR